MSTALKRPHALPQQPSSPGVHRTDIEWTDYAVGGPVRFRHRKTGQVVNACVKVSSGCANCYSEAIGTRFRRGFPYTRAAMADLEPFLDEGTLRHMLTFRPSPPWPVGMLKSRCRYKDGGQRPRVFVGDMTDLFGDWVKREWLDRIFAVFALRQDVDWQLLTKRPGPDGMAGYLRTLEAAGSWHDIREHLALVARDMPTEPGQFSPRRWSWSWPLQNVWLGTSVENQRAADDRTACILDCPAAIRFLSCEPLLGPIDLRLFPGDLKPDWVIVGGESGTGAREFNIEWARDVIAQCRVAGVPVFVKQLGSRPFQPRGGGQRIEIEISGKGGDPDQWPADLRVREWPGNEPENRQ